MNNQATAAANPLGYESIGKLLRKFAIPSIIAMMVNALYNIVDQFFIGQKIGELGNAATNVAFPLTTVCTALSLLLGVGSAAAFNLSMGRGDKQKAIHYIGNAVVLLFGFGIVLCTVTLIFLRPMLVFFGSPSDVLPYAEEYVRITAFGFPFLILTTGGAHLIRADGSPNFSMISNLTGAVINTILDPIFIFVLDMDMAGAALATVLGQIASAAMVIIYMCRFKAAKLTLSHLKPTPQIFGYAMGLGLAQFFNQLAMMVVQVVMNNSLTYYGRLSTYGEAIPLAASGVINKVNFIFLAICIGLSQAMQPVSSFNYGAGNYERVKKVIKTTIGISSIVHIIAFLTFQIFPRQIIGIFGGNSELYFEFAVRYMRISLFFTFINNIQPMSSTFFTSIGKPAKGAFLSLTRQTLFLLPLMVIFPQFWGIDGIMYAAPVADILAMTISAIMLISQLKKLDQMKKDVD